MSSSAVAAAPAPKAAAALFACSKCYTRHPFEELSTGQQLCKVSKVILASSTVVTFTTVSSGMLYLYVICTNDNYHGAFRYRPHMEPIPHLL